MQDLGYRATFPLLLNIAGEPTYFIPLLDDASLVKMLRHGERGAVPAGGHRGQRRGRVRAELHRPAAPERHRRRELRPRRDRSRDRHRAHRGAAQRRHRRHHLLLPAHRGRLVPGQRRGVRSRGALQPGRHRHAGHPARRREEIIPATLSDGE